MRFGDGWFDNGVDAAEVTDVRRRLPDLTGTADSDLLTPASAPVPRSARYSSASPLPGRPLGGPTPTAAGRRLGRLTEMGLTVGTLRPAIGAEHVDEALRWVAAEVAPRLT